MSTQKLGPLFYIGAAGLLAAMGVEALAVAGRQLATPFLGALELIRAAIVLTTSAAMLSATLSHSHAAVRLVTDRLTPVPRKWLGRFAALLSALFFLGLAAGALWLSIEFWHAHEESELLHIPFRPLRVIAFLSVAAIAGVFLYRTGKDQ
jgi:TRAP-type C4-dicarboxylate transport system permease small subunit